MRSYYYPSGRSAFGALFLALLAFGSGKLWYEGGGFAVLAFAAVMVLGTAKLALDAMSREPALKFDRHSIWIKKTWGGFEEVPWRDVHDIAAKLLTWRYMGIIPVSKTSYLTVTREGGLTGARRLRVSTSAMGLSAAATAELVLALKKAQLEAIGEAGIAMAAAGRHGWGVGVPDEAGEPADSSGFDADAALARYLASKQAGVQAETGAEAPAAPPIMQQRPIFGRKVG